MFFFFFSKCNICCCWVGRSDYWSYEGRGPQVPPLDVGGAGAASAPHVVGAASAAPTTTFPLVILVFPVFGGGLEGLEAGGLAGLGGRHHGVLGVQVHPGGTHRQAGVSRRARVKSGIHYTLITCTLDFPYIKTFNFIVASETYSHCKTRDSRLVFADRCNKVSAI